MAFRHGRYGSYFGIALGNYDDIYTLIRQRYARAGKSKMRNVISLGNRLGVPVILDTDAKSKCDKYIHLGMELAGTRRFGEYGVLYDLIKYPDRSDSEEKRRIAK